MKIPTCNKCGKEHYNVQACPKPQAPPQYLRRQPPPDGYHLSLEWGVNTKSVPIIYTVPPQPRHGRVIGTDGNIYTPVPPDAA